jgi:hypothetical protein
MWKNKKDTEVTTMATIYLFFLYHMKERRKERGRKEKSTFYQEPQSIP